MKPSDVEKLENFEFQQKTPSYYKFDVIISVGYSVKSLHGTNYAERYVLAFK